ncbi:hypothetical protein HYP58_gp27 [Vibrio phage 1.097.O._10N.286.49.B3]|uniref:Coil containing protein n=1 Tax=Vibrio phage 1.097.O._10N.286.49.B3 TaxID=1881383 RepID=A0A2I7R0K6_9CAUD|nr:hypothetical protein HYP58_gp27 [Vibrio phage 1.097.O._10N.286.49.B3]AUR87173.1 hypothetical protein NVP1097O_27 [Vibrio phage 1.097.O._10N.286.49.B3]
MANYITGTYGTSNAPKYTYHSAHPQAQAQPLKLGQGAAQDIERSLWQGLGVTQPESYIQQSGVPADRWAPFYSDTAQRQLFSIGNIGLDGNAIDPTRQSGMGGMGNDISLGFNPLESSGTTAGTTVNTQGSTATLDTLGVDPNIFQAIGNHTDGSWVGNPNIDNVGTNPQQQPNFLTGVGNTISNGWEAIGGMQGLATGLNAVSGIGQTALGFQQLGLAEDQFNFTRNAWQSDYDMRLQDYNRRVTRQDSKDSALAQ